MYSVSEKLQILAESARYDASCASSGSQVSRPGRLGATVRGGVCHTWTADGRCVSLLKILYTNICIYDCAYCVNRCSNDIPRAAFSPQELAAVTMNFYEKNYIEGLFLSSGVIRSPDYTMERMVETVRLLRESHLFRGYVHVKLIPGASAGLIAHAGRLADRVSVNIELPTRQSLAHLAPQKDADAILTPMRQVSTAIAVARTERRTVPRYPAFSPAGQSTQLIVGATPESDRQIMRLSSWLYRTMRLKRVYYSAYVPVNGNVPAPAPPLLREHRLYQADWLIRMYGFSLDEFLPDEYPQLDTEIDPKVSWAFRHLGQFPVDVNTASYEQLIRVPGIGMRSAGRIVRVRRVKRLHLHDLTRLPIGLRRAQYFITVDGKRLTCVKLDPELLRQRLAGPYTAAKPKDRQRELFPLPTAADAAAAITGEF